MSSNYLLIAYRRIRRNLSYVFLNVSGLALSVAACLLIFLVVKYEFGYDRFHHKADRIYRVTFNELDLNPSVSFAIAPALRNDFPELENVTSVWFREGALLKAGNTKYMEKNFAFADEYFTRMFDYEWAQGDPHTALKEPNSIVLTQSLAKKYFGSKDPMGQIIRFDNEHDVKVTGLLKDIPGNTHLPFNYLISFSTIRKDIEGIMKELYAIAGGTTYILLPPHYDVAKLQQRMTGFLRKNWGEDAAKKVKLPLQPLTDIHFDQRYIDAPASPTTSRDIYWGLAAIAVFIILIACINFINLATAQALNRAREVGVRKALGAGRIQLIRQFLSETTMLVVFALLSGCLLAWIFLPDVMQWMNLKISRTQLLQPDVLLLMLALIVVVILGAGLYPAFVQSAFDPVTSLKGATSSTFKGVTLRKALVLVQFGVSQALIIGTLIVAHQMDYLKNQDLGFNKEAMISIDIPDWHKSATIESVLAANPGVAGYAFSSGSPANSAGWAGFTAPDMGLTDNNVTELKFIDEKYTDLFELKMLAGEKIARIAPGDTVANAVVNESMIHKLGITSPAAAIGKRINVRKPVIIAGVVADFQSESRHKKRRPCVILYEPSRLSTANIKIQPGQLHKVIDQLNHLWTRLFPDEIFGYEFVDDHIAAMYQQEEKTYTAFRLFSSLAILIGCLGLYGLVAFAAVQRTREVGIRKVLGASTSDIIVLFAREFVVLIALAFVLAAPLAYFAMQQWLSGFAYQVHIGGSTFLLAIITSLAIALITIAHQSLKAAIANPLKSLKTE
ncbi:ABC transporter permease [Chitinophaga vietnamensis]|uniref:ABC transporter permease n=1 Tax=Chitinophaga vietnamensis TaxID=2593957 RepID=UPI00117893F1|nr:ABC transporter permease [Chitinophaga vietnamensis]